MVVGHCCAWQAALWCSQLFKQEHGCTGSLRSEGSVPDTTCGWWHEPPPQPRSLLLNLPPAQPSSLVPAPKDWLLRLQPQVWAARWQRKCSSCARSTGQASGGVARGPSTWCVRWCLVGMLNTSLMSHRPVQYVHHLAVHNTRPIVRIGSRPKKGGSRPQPPAPPPVQLRGAAAAAGFDASRSQAPPPAGKGQKVSGVTACLPATPSSDPIGRSTPSPGRG